MNGPIEWIAAIGTIIAAALVAADLGRTITGWGFVLFCIVAVLWVYSGLTSPEGTPIAVQNGVLLLVNMVGIWQYWLSPKNRKKMEVAAEAIEEAEAKGKI